MPPDAEPVERIVSINEAPTGRWKRGFQSNGGVAGVEWPQSIAMTTRHRRPFAPSTSRTPCVTTGWGIEDSTPATPSGEDFGSNLVAYSDTSTHGITTN